MSHTTEIGNIVFSDIDALRAAVNELNTHGVKCSLEKGGNPRAFYANQQGMGAADLPQGVRRQDEFFTTHDRNEEDDGVSLKLLPVLKEKTAELSQFLKDITVPPSANTRLPRPVVQNYEIVEAIPPGNYHFAGNSVGLKGMVNGRTHGQ